MRRLLTDAAQRFYAADRDCPLRYEPSGQDFLSPCLAEADFMRRVLDHAAFARWLKTFLPMIPGNARTEWLTTRGRHESHRSEARAPRWPESQSRVDARGDSASDLRLPTGVSGAASCAGVTVMRRYRR